MRPTISTTAAALGVLLSVAGCSEPKPQAQLSETLPQILVPPSGSIVSKEGGADALKIRFKSSLTPDQVAKYYREVLSKAPWSLVSDTPAADSSISLYAERPTGPPLWVTIHKTAGGSFVDLAGAKIK